MLNQHSQSLFISRMRRCFGSVTVSLFSIALLVSLPANAAQVEAQQTEWSMTGSLSTGRFGHTATLLANGKVLVVGGRACSPGCTEFSSAELYDPAAGAWEATGSLSVPRRGHIAVRLPNGKVLVAGGYSGPTTWNTSELYDPVTGAWSPTANLSSARAFATATLLASGKVLVAGGGRFANNEPALDTAELYDPALGSWSPAGRMNSPRRSHTATLLADGRVLIISGNGATLDRPMLLLTAELYDPINESWTPTGSLATARVSHTGTTLKDGKVIVTGGNNFGNTIYDTTEFYDPSTGQWSATGRLTATRMSHTATLLASGKVLVVGGLHNDPVNFIHRSAELYDPAAGTWTPTADLSAVRGDHAATLLADGRVLVSGGRLGDSSGLAGAELFDGTTATPQILGASISGKRLFVEGRNFDEGAKVYLNDEKQKTATETPTTLLQCKKAGKQIERGATVRLKVRNSDGTESAEFIYTRPVE